MASSTPTQLQPPMRKRPAIGIQKLHRRTKDLESVFTMIHVDQKCSFVRFMQAVFVCGILIFRTAASFSPQKRRLIAGSRLVVMQTNDAIDLQSDSTLYGRGDMHLSAVLEEDDVVVYQTGTWMVDGVEVGDGTPAEYQYARVENVQIVWTHNCEHGVIRGVAVKPNFTCEPPSFVVQNEQVEFGPEQLVARILTKWNENMDEGVSLADFDELLWK